MSLMRKNVWAAVMAFALLSCWSAGCTDKKPERSDSTSVDSAKEDTLQVDTLDKLITETPMPKAADELFDDFIFNFAANRKLQLKRIEFPLPVDKFGKLSHLTKKNWRMEHFFMNQCYYTLIFDSRRQMSLAKDTTIDKVTIEKINLKRKTVKQYFFYRKMGQWKLCGIRYKGTYESNNASFLKFYDRFAVDTAFQNRSINDPVEFTGPDPDDDFSTMTGTIEPWQWPSFAPELPHGLIYNILYGQTYKESNLKIFVLRGISNGFETQLTFRKRGGKWKLIKLVQ